MTLIASVEILENTVEGIERRFKIANESLAKVIACRESGEAFKSKMEESVDSIISNFDSMLSYATLFVYDTNALEESDETPELVEALGRVVNRVDALMKVVCGHSELQPIADYFFTGSVVMPLKEQRILAAILCLLKTALNRLK